MKKKNILILCFILLLLATYVYATGSTYKGYPIANIKLNGEHVIVTTGVPPIIMDGRVMVPIRLAGEALGADIRWDQGTQTVLIIKGNEEETVDSGPKPSSAAIKITNISFNSIGTQCSGKIENRNSMSVKVRYTIHFYNQGEYLGHLHGEEKNLLAGKTVKFTLDAKKEFRDYSNYECVIDSITKS